MSEQYNWQQKVLSLIWLTYCLSIPKTYFGSQQYLQTFATKAIKANFADAQIRNLIGTWELVWGCGIFQASTRLAASEVNDHTMFVAKYKDNPDIDQYVIALAGTNPFSLQNILIEDVNIAIAIPWNNGQPWKSTQRLTKNNNQPAVTEGVSRALKILYNDMPSDGKLLLDTLKEITTNATKPVQITVAGHSLAGAMSASLALSLVDRQSEWDDKKIATVHVVSVAGFSPGNDAFANHYDTTFGDKSQRLWNQLDIVPNIWTVEGIKKVPGIYAPAISPSITIQLVFQGLEIASAAQNYTHINRTTPGFASTYNPSFSINNLAHDPDLKQVVLDVVSGFIAYTGILQLKTLPFLSHSLEDKMTHFVKEFAEEIRQVLDQMITRQADVEQALKDRLNEVINRLSGLQLNLFFLPIPDELNKLFATSRIRNLINYILQVLYHHVWRYSEYYGFTEFDKRRQEITTQVAAQLQEAQAQVQTENTVIVNYGRAKKDDINDLFHGEGKLFKGISGVMERLKKTGQVSPNAQPVIFIVEKKKDDGKF